VELSLPVLRYRCTCVKGLVYSQTSKRYQSSGLGAVFLKKITMLTDTHLSCWIIADTKITLVMVVRN